MSRKSIKIATLVMLLMCLLGLWSSSSRGVAGSRAEDARLEARSELNAESRSRCGAGEAGDLVLRMALVSMASRANLEAILDAVEIPLYDREEFSGYLGFESPAVESKDQTLRS